MINFISVDNGVGLSRDMRLLGDVLGIKYNFIDFNSNRAVVNGKINVFFEVINKHHLNSLGRNILVPNPEWFASEWLGLLSKFDAVFCKTRHCQEVFSKYVGDKAIYTGWTSEDRYTPLEVAKNRNFLHTAGKSETKGTKNTLKAFTLDGMDKAALIVTSNKNYSWLKGTENIKVVNNRLNESSFKYLQNAIQFHVCCSEYEGFGHYINEAKSTGAIIITTNAAPMSEMCDKSFSMLCKADKYRLMGIVDTWSVGASEIANAVIKCRNLSDKQVAEMSEASRQSFIDNDNLFRAKIKEVW